MATELTGRALDEAAARAMGRTTSPSPWCNFAVIPPYSTDPAHIPEMWRSGDFEAATINSDRHRLDCRVGGSTLSEALARLVVAMAEAQP